MRTWQIIRGLLLLAVAGTVIYWRSWSCSVGEATMGREMTHTEQFHAFFFNEWPKGG